ncbi:MAG: hypothetical protein M3214_00240 [Actinomycetota bacterium]|nr:hypothetical protein [Actinomycetota bacterium]
MRTVTLSGLLIGVVLIGCGADPVIDPGDGGDYEVQVKPADFVATIDNPWLPFRPGSRWTYAGREGDRKERIEVLVTDDTRKVMGITATVVREREWLDGRLVEDTFDWYAQDHDGNVWYLGEDTREFTEGGGVSTAGAWEAGVDEALPGIIMLADPRVGEAYRQEYLPGEAEDMAEVIRRGASVSVPFGSFDRVLVTKEWTPLEPSVVEQKYYDRGVGLILEETVRGGSARTELVDYSPAG